jgi:hypothetical protein
MSRLILERYVQYIKPPSLLTESDSVEVFNYSN